MSDDVEELDVYYRIYRDDEGEPIVVCMQWFDELDYESDRFVSAARYDEEDQANEALIRHLWKQQNPLLAYAFELAKQGEWGASEKVIKQLYADTHPRTKGAHDLF